MIVAEWTKKAMTVQLSGMDPEAGLAWLLQIAPQAGPKVESLIAAQQRKVDARLRELARLEGLREMERDLWLEGLPLVGGIDEAGRGPLAGPVVAACVILPHDVWLERLDDSKKLSAPVRERLYGEIREKAVSWGIGICDAGYIDRVNILNATRKAMLLAVQAMKRRPDAFIIDAVRLPLPERQVSVPRADSRCLAVAAASVLAKVTRDRIMDKLDAEWPAYGFIRNKGYGTAEHMAALHRAGPCPLHRQSFIGGILGAKNGRGHNPLSSDWQGGDRDAD
jgi:ribonuclease HII